MSLECNANCNPSEILLAIGRVEGQLGMLASLTRRVEALERKTENNSRQIWLATGGAAVLATVAGWVLKSGVIGA